MNQPDPKGGVMQAISLTTWPTSSWASPGKPPAAAAAQRHSLTALDDVVVILTVAVGSRTDR